jgi:ATP-dependent protease HslVU (ClpYQ) peptidase subunit
MTILAALTHGGKVYMGADRSMSDNNFISALAKPKIRKVGPYLIGYAGSLGTGQLTTFATYPDINTTNLEAWMRIQFCGALQKAADEFKIDINNDDNGADLLVGVAGRLFEISTIDWSVGEYAQIATGSGFPYAMGSLHTTRYTDDPHWRIREAVAAAIKYSPSCVGPIDILAA